MRLEAFSHRGSPRRLNVTQQSQTCIIFNVAQFAALRSGSADLYFGGGGDVGGCEEEWWWWWWCRSKNKQPTNTFAVAFIPGKDTVLDAVAHQRGVDAHVAVAEERAAHTGSCNTKSISNTEGVIRMSTNSKSIRLLLKPG